MEEEYLATIAKYVEGEKGKRPVDKLAAGFGRLIAIMEETRADILGDLFQGGITYGERGQFFTPHPFATSWPNYPSETNRAWDARSAIRVAGPDECCSRWQG